MTASITLAHDASQSDRAALGIRDLLLTGEFKAGDRLPELMLVDRLGMSRTPIRAALQRLAEEGLLEAGQNTGYVVRGFSEADIFDAIEVRGTLEGLAGRMAAERGVSRVVLDQMRDCIDQIDALFERANPGLEELNTYAALNSRFHELLLQSAGSEMVERAIARIVSMPFASPNAFTLVQARIPGSHDILRLAQLQHREILDAIESRSSARVEPIIREHARIARKNLELALRNADALQHLAGAPLIRRRKVV